MIKNNNEIFPVVDECGNVVGKATREECHSGSMLLHPVVHLHIVSKESGIYLQKRSMSKDIQPGKWDTSVGGHVDYGESVKDALMREAREELGFMDFMPIPLEPYVFKSSVERELINPFFVIVKDKIIFNPDKYEVEEGRFWTWSEVNDNIGKNVFTPNFESEYQKFKDTLSGNTLEIE